MSIIRTQKSTQTPYVLIYTTALDDHSLSFRAKGLYAYLMSRPDGGDVSLADLEHLSPTEGPGAIRKALRELRTSGYLPSGEP